MSQESERYQPKSVIWRESGYTNHIKAVQGVSDFHESFDNEFSEFKTFIKLVNDTVYAIQFNALNVKKVLDNIPFDFYVSKLFKLWSGNCFFGIVETNNKIKKDFLYEIDDNSFFASRGEQYNRTYIKTNKEDYFELIRLPKLQNMVPVGQIKDDTWGIQIREEIPIKYAFSGVSYDTVINDGVFAFRSMSGLVPKFSQSEMRSLNLKSYIIARGVYNHIMTEYKNEFYPIYGMLQATNQLIIDFIDEGDLTSIIPKQKTVLFGKV